MRSVVVVAARLTPGFVKRFVQRNRLLYGLERRLFAWLIGRKPVAIVEGPLKGVLLVPGEHISHAHIQGTYEAETQQAIVGCVRQGFVCYDLGASIGYLSLLMARFGGKVFAFEPAPHAAKEILKQSTVNGFDQIEVVPSPVSHDERDVTFALTDVAFGSGINENQTRWPTIKLRTITLDKFALDHPPPDFIKIDVEGEEGMVLEGARGLLRQKRPVIICELHSRSAADHVARVLAEFNYSMETLDGQAFRPELFVTEGQLQVLCKPL